MAVSEVVIRNRVISVRITSDVSGSNAKQTTATRAIGWQGTEEWGAMCGVGVSHKEILEWK